MKKGWIVLLVFCLIGVFPSLGESKYKEAPMLAAMVKAGKLPPVQQRLPENPLVVSAGEIGQYGGVWRRGFMGPSDFNGVNRLLTNYSLFCIFNPSQKGGD